MFHFVYWGDLKISGLEHWFYFKLSSLKNLKMKPADGTDGKQSYFSGSVRNLVDELADIDFTVKFFRGVFVLTQHILT